MVIRQLATLLSKAIKPPAPLPGPGLFGKNINWTVGTSQMPKLSKQTKTIAEEVGKSSSTDAPGPANNYSSPM